MAVDDSHRDAGGGGGSGRSDDEANGRRVTYSYDLGGRVTTVRDPSARTQVFTYKVPAPRPGPFVVEARDAYGRAVRWEWATATPAEDRAGLERDFVALLNAVDLLPVLSPRWRLRSFQGRDRQVDGYAWDEATGTVTVTAGAGGEAREFRHSFEARLTRLTDAETGAVTHVVEPATAEAVYAFDASGTLRRDHPPGAARRPL
ncbi:MAG: hypothetical protein KatS3mg108_2570 [Isosphaeraceae bacterium]|jgi:YD repeat-containing protein|nr:MAG: hypothetical protein KatS3mg108_2570 [Isosphaeraceae bacterium]